MKEWFDPISQVFLASIIKRKFQQGSFRDERILLFCGRKEIDELESIYLDGYYARRLSEIHVQYGIPLGYLPRSRICEILDGLTCEEKKALRCYPALPDWFPKRLLQLMLRRRKLDFALVEGQDGNKCVLVVSKEGENVRIRRMRGELVAPYTRFVELIKKQVYKPNSPQFEEEYDFVKFFYPFALPVQTPAAIIPATSAVSEDQAAPQKPEVETD